MLVGFGVSTETARSVVKNFRKQRKSFNAPEKTLIRRSYGTLSTKSEIRIDSKEDLLEPPMNIGFARTSKQTKDALVIDFTGGKYNQKIVDWDGSRLKEEGRTEYLDVRVGNYRLNA